MKALIAAMLAAAISYAGSAKERPRNILPVPPPFQPIECMSDADCPCNSKCLITTVTDSCGREVPDGAGFCSRPVVNPQ